MGRQDEEEMGDGCVTMLIAINQDPQITVVCVFYELDCLEKDILTFLDILVYDIYVPQ